jgi:branched-chain amino acid transport system permease protein
VESDKGSSSSTSRRFHVSPLYFGILATGTLAFLVATPWLLNPYWNAVIVTIMMYATLAEAWNIITGFVGYPAFGNVAFFGVGAYTVSVFTLQLDWPFLLSLLACFVVAALLCIVVGSPLLRTRGHYFAISTVALALALQQLTYLVPFLPTAGSGSVVLDPFDLPGVSEPNAAFFLMLFLLVVTVCFTYWVSKSRFGYGLKSIRADEHAAHTYGIPVHRFKISAWAVSAGLSGATGAVWATWVGAIDPVSAYDFQIAQLFCVIALIGGLGSVIGPLLGAVVIGLLSEFMRARFPDVHALVLGIIIMVGILLTPYGLVGLTRPENSFRARIHALKGSAWQ